jgi:deoxyribodipyrimidine photolyase-related protein
MHTFLLYPIHLFSNIENLFNKKVYLLEEPRYFKDFKYHKLKLVYHRASMKSYFDYLREKNINVEYVPFDRINKSFYNKLKKNEMECYDVNDLVLENKLKKQFPNLILHNSLNFTLNPEIINENKQVFMNKNGGYRHDLFYEWQRRRLNILMTTDGKPKGGKWSFDKDNRKPLPKSVRLTFEPEPIENNYYEF